MNKKLIDLEEKVSIANEEREKLGSALAEAEDVLKKYPSWPINPVGSGGDG